MRMIARCVGAAVVSLSVSGCTTMHSMPQPTPSAIKRDISVGAEVRVLTKRGKDMALVVTRVEDDALFGKATSDGKTYKVPYAAIETLDYAQTSTGKTAAVTLGVAAALLIIVVSTMDFDLAPSN